MGQQNIFKLIFCLSLLGKKNQNSQRTFLKYIYTTFEYIENCNSKYFDSTLD